MQLVYTIIHIIYAHLEAHCMEHRVRHPMGQVVVKGLPTVPADHGMAQGVRWQQPDYTTMDITIHITTPVITIIT